MTGGKGSRDRHHSAKGKCKHPPSPPLEDFGGSELSEEEFSSEYDSSPLPVSPMVSSNDSDDSMVLLAAERAYIRFVERARLGGLDDSEGRTPQGNPPPPWKRTPQTLRKRAAVAVVRTTVTTVWAVAAATRATVATAATPVATCHRCKQ
jgi:hypothetical protein